MMINLTRWYYRGDNRSRAKHLKIVLHEIYVLPIKNWIWNKIIDTKHGWEEYIMIDVEDRLDVDQLVSERAEEYNEMRNDND
jgi:hypothetical protein